MESELAVPWSVRVRLGHAAVQWVADEQGIDVLHLKGFALDESLRWPGREGTDVDVLVRPAHVSRFVAALAEQGWTLETGFQAGSAFGHAATLWHEQWGHADVHRTYPGFGVGDEEAFDRLWSARHAIEIGGRACFVPPLPAQMVVLLLHAARSHGSPRAKQDVEVAWGRATAEQRRAARGWVSVLGAELAFAAALGSLDSFRHHQEYPLWRVSSEGGTRIQEWAARIAAAPTVGAAVRLLLRIPVVNVEHLAVLLGRQPTLLEIVREFFARPIRGLREEWTRARRRDRGAGKQ